MRAFYVSDLVRKQMLRFSMERVQAFAAFMSKVPSQGHGRTRLDFTACRESGPHRRPPVSLWQHLKQALVAEADRLVHYLGMSKRGLRPERKKTPWIGLAVLVSICIILIVNTAVWIKKVPVTVARSPACVAVPARLGSRAQLLAAKPVRLPDAGKFRSVHSGVRVDPIRRMLCHP